VNKKEDSKNDKLDLKNNNQVAPNSPNSKELIQINDQPSHSQSHSTSSNLDKPLGIGKKENVINFSSDNLVENSSS